MSSTLALAAAVTEKTSSPSAPAPVPRIPETLAETGIAESMVEQLILKILYYRNEVLGRDLATALGLKFSAVEGMIEFLKRQHLVQVKKSLGMGNISAVYALSDNGRTVAREYLEANQYCGRVPVPLEQYRNMVLAQKRPESWLTMEMLKEAFGHMVVTPEILTCIGPAVNAGKSFLIYGQPGNGKTFLAEALFKVVSQPIYIPSAIEAQGMIIQVFDPIFHHPVEQEDTGSLLALAKQPTFDQRWIRIHPPFITTGGELDMTLLDLAYNPVAKFYDAPLQMKANNGIYLIDDFGRQRSTPAEILNRWIIPMERGIDFLTFKNGSKVQVPFECFLIFSSNLKPHQLGDEAFLRRIQYKMLLKNPDEAEYCEIFKRFCEKNNLPFDEVLLDRFLQKHYRNTGKKRRRCHPRDILNHAIDLLRFERRPWKLTEEVLDHAFDSCFVNTEDEG